MTREKGGDGGSEDDSCNERLEELLGVGRFQYFIIFSFVSVISIVGAWDLLQLAFSIGDGQYRCSLPPEIEAKLANKTIFEDHMVGSCEMSRYKYYGECADSNNPSDIFADETCFNMEDKVSCTDAYGYVHMRNYSGEFWSLKSENSWVCDKDYYAANVYTAFTAGRIVWLIVTLPIIDSWGRKPIVYGACIVAMVFRIIAFLVHDYYWAMLVCIAISGPFGMGVRCALTLVSEYCNAQGRTLGYAVCWVTWVLGLAVLPLVAWQCQDWFTYGIAVPLTLLTVLPFYWLTPESPRLLLTLGKVTEAEAVIRKIKHINMDEIPDDLHDQLVAISKVISSPKKSKFKSVFKSRRLVFNLVMMSVVWIVNEVTYGAGMLNSGNFAGNQFVNFSLMSLTELPSAFIGQLVIDHLGRRWSNVGCMAGSMLAQAAIVVTLAVDPVVGTTLTVLAIIGRVFSNVSWYIMWVQTVEVFSTDVRGGAASFVGLVSSIAGLSVPYLTMLGIESPLVMYIILTAVGVIGTVATSLLPETYGQPMLECVEDLEQIVRHPFFSFRVWKNSKGPSVAEEGTKEETDPLKKPAKFTDLTSEI